MSDSKQAVLFVNLWPEPKSSAAGVRTFEMGLFVKRLGYELFGISPNAASEHSNTWEKSGIRILTCDPNSSASAEVLKTLSPELVIFDRFYTEEKYGWRARELWPLALQVIDTSDLHSLRAARQKAHLAGSAVLQPSDEFFDEDLLREMAALHRADVCLVVSPFEVNWLIQHGFEKERICYLPFSAQPEANFKPLRERHEFCFLGNYLHKPNVDAVQWLASELWPALRKKLPEAELHLYGAYPSQVISQLHKKNGIFSHGFVENHREAIARHEVMLAPLRFGAGIKGKILEAWATGTPVLGTPLAFEGMGDGFAEFKNSEEFIEQVLLLQNPNYWQKNVEAGLQELEKSFNQELIFKTFADFLANSQTQLENIRRSLTGRMLRHHSSQYLKYFSMWIEEKNKQR